MMMRMRMISKWAEFFERARLKVGHHDDEDENEDEND